MSNKLITPEEFTQHVMELIAKNEKEAGLKPGQLLNAMVEEFGDTIESAELNRMEH